MRHDGPSVIVANKYTNSSRNAYAMRTMRIHLSAPFTYAGKSVNNLARPNFASVKIATCLLMMMVSNQRIAHVTESRVVSVVIDPEGVQHVLTRASANVDESQQHAEGDTEMPNSVTSS